jgi:hypothetical protein
MSSWQESTSSLLTTRCCVPLAGVCHRSSAERVDWHQQHDHVLRPNRCVHPLLCCAAACPFTCSPAQPAALHAGAGKTYTMTGGRQSYSQRGLVPRVLSQLFQEVRGRTDRLVTVQVGLPLKSCSFQHHGATSARATVAQSTSA